MLRRLTHADFVPLAELLAFDPAHKDILTPDFWFQKKQFSCALCDEKGVVVYMRLGAEPPAMRIWMQFIPDQRRVARAMLKDWAEVRSLIVKAGATEMVFDTVNPKLAAFCCKAYGFRRDGQSNDYRLLLQELPDEKAAA